MVNYLQVPPTQSRAAILGMWKLLYYHFNLSNESSELTVLCSQQICTVVSDTVHDNSLTTVQ